MLITNGNKLSHLMFEITSILGLIAKCTCGGKCYTLDHTITYYFKTELDYYLYTIFSIEIAQNNSNNCLLLALVHLTSLKMHRETL